MKYVVALALSVVASNAIAADEIKLARPGDRFELTNLFDLELATDPQIAPDGTKVVFSRVFGDIMKDRFRSDLWIVDADGRNLEALTSDGAGNSSPRWSRDQSRIAFVSAADGTAQIYVRYLATNRTAKITSLQRGPGDLAWSPDGKFIAFTMFVPVEVPPIATLPAKPEGAEWAKPARVIQRVQYRADGAGYLEDGFEQLFIVPAEGGTPLQLTNEAFHHGGPLCFAPDGKSIVFSGNRHAEWEYDGLDTEICEVSLESGALNAIKDLTNRRGPDQSPALSADGRWIAYTGFDDRRQGYQCTHLYVMKRDGSAAKCITEKFDRDVEQPRWSADGSGIYFQYDDQGNTKIGFATLDGTVMTLVKDVGGLSAGRPYNGGSFSVDANGAIAFTYSRPEFPADVALVETRVKSPQVVRLTRLNDDLFATKRMATTEEIGFESSFDKKKIQGWIVKPPDFDPAKKYPLILEIHGGPFADYGDRFASEFQLYAAAGYVVLYANPRGSTSYGAEFGNLIHHDYPNHDYDDLMSGVDAVIARGFIDPKNLFVTGGSGGGVLTAWIVGKTDRFRAAVSAKPVIDWYSFALTSDDVGFYSNYWFPGPPWENTEQYLKRSPLTYVGNVKTPTMLLTGESDYRTPISQSEEFYSALKLRKIDTALVRIPEASHNMDARPSQLMTKIAHILAWFEKYKSK